MSSELHRLRRGMIEAGGRTAQTFGLNRLLGQIYTVLYLSPDPLNLDALVEALGVSKASISIACRQLESHGAVCRVWVEGDRRDYYEAETDFSVVMQQGVLDSLEKKLEAARKHLASGRETLHAPGGHDEVQTFIHRRLDRAERYRARMAGLLHNPLLRKIL